MENEIPMYRDEKKTYDFERIEALIEEKGGMAKTGDILALGIDYRRLLSFLDEGKLKRIKNGYYGLADDDDEEKLIATMFKDGILTMASGLFYQGYLKMRPSSWSIAVSKNVSKSRFKLSYPVITPYYCEESAMSFGVEIKNVGGQMMKVYTKDRLACEVLKYEDKISRDDFKEGLLNYIKDESKNVEKLMEFAAKRKVTNKVRQVIGVWL